MAGFLAALVFVGCGADASAGRFALSAATPDDSGVAVDDSGSGDWPPGVAQSFDLGDLKASRDFYFLLRNVGGRPITGIQLASSNPAFAVTPALMDSLDADPSATIVRLVRLSITHGTALEGVGYSPLLPMGRNTTTLTVSGRTNDGSGAAVSLTTAVGISVTALVMDAELADGDTVLAWQGGGTVSAPGLPTCPEYGHLTAPRLTNTGNVPLTVTYTTDYAAPFTDLAVLAPGDPSLDLAAGMPTYTEVFFRLDGGHAVGDRDRLPICEDGKVLFAMAFSP